MTRKLVDIPENLIQRYDDEINAEPTILVLPKMRQKAAKIEATSKCTEGEQSLKSQQIWCVQM
jgi:hypothetical protein